MTNSDKDGDSSQSTAAEAEDSYNNGLEAMKNRDSLSALHFFEKAVKLERVPIYLSSLAFCLAKEKREFPKSISLCKEAIKYEPRNAAHFLQLGRIYLLAGQRKESIHILRMGLRIGKNAEISRELERLGSRKEPVLPFLGRGNPLNKYLGIVLKKSGLR